MKPNKKMQIILSVIYLLLIILFYLQPKLIPEIGGINIGQIIMVGSIAGLFISALELLGLKIPSINEVSKK